MPVRESARVGRNVEETLPRRCAVVVVAKIKTIGSTQPMDHPRLEVGDEELLVPAVISDVAEAGARIGARVE